MKWSFSFLDMKEITEGMKQKPEWQCDLIEKERSKHRIDKPVVGNKLHRCV